MSFTHVLTRGLAPAAAAATGLAVLACAALPAAQAAAAGIHATGTVSLPGASLSSAFGEAPGGAVYYSAGSAVYVVNGTSAPAPAFTATGKVLAIAATSADVLVDVNETVTEYNHAGAQVRHWKLTGPHKRTSATLRVVGSTVWAMTDWATDASGLEYGNVYRFSASAATVHRVSTSAAYPYYAEANSSGLFYEAIRGNGTNGYVVRVTPSGSLHRVTDTNLSGPLALAGGKVEVLAPHYGSHGSLKLYIDSYRQSTLAHTHSRHVSIDARDLADTSLGLTELSAPASCQSLACPGAEISVLSSATGATTSTLKVPDALTVLDGSSAVVLTETGGSIDLVRLAK